MGNREEKRLTLIVSNLLNILEIKINIRYYDEYLQRPEIIEC